MFILAALEVSDMNWSAFGQKNKKNNSVTFALLQILDLKQEPKAWNVSLMQNENFLKCSPENSKDVKSETWRD